MSAMRYIAILVLLAAPAFAQQAPPDPAAAMWRQLLDEANGRFVGAAAQVQSLAKQVEDLKKEAEAAKGKP